MLALLLASIFVVSAKTIARRDVSSVPGFNYDKDKLRGVNLGGWFVLEPYMTPSLFNHGWDPSNVPVDEYHFTKQLGKEKAGKILENHWDTWIQESDFHNISSWGLNFVRIPIGYWAFLERPEDPYVQGQVKYLDRAIGWARNTGIKLWIDIHGVPGSQNGFDNSGLRDHYDFQKYHNTEDALKTLDIVINKYGGPDYYDVIVGIQPVNEPLGPVLNMDKLKKYYSDSYDKLRAKGYQGLVLHDAFQAKGYWNNVYNNPQFNIIVDHHEYQVFNIDQLKRSIDQHIEAACNIGRELKTKENKWRVIGEWSAALTDCAPLLNGVYRGARWDGSFQNDHPLGSCDGSQDISTWSEQRKADTRRYIDAQLDAYEYGGSGWVFWAYKTENTLEWDAKRLVENGLFPNPVTERKYKNQCGF